MNKTMDSLLESLKASRGARHALEKHPLEDVSDFIRNKYLQVLCAVMMYRGTVSDEQLLYLERLVAGAKAEHAAESYLRMAAQISSETLGKLLDSLGKNKELGLLKGSLVLDLLVVCHLTNCGDAQVGFIAELIDALSITSEELTFLLELAQVVLTLDKKKAKKLHWPSTMKSTTFSCYFKLLRDDKPSVSFENMSTVDGWRYLDNKGKIRVRRVR